MCECEKENGGKRRDNEKNEIERKKIRNFQTFGRKKKKRKKGGGNTKEGNRKRRTTRSN